MGMSISRKGFFDDMTTEKNLFLFAMLLGVTQTKVRETMKEFAIDFGNVRFGKLSAGMKQRVSLIPPFIRHNDLILLDEPSNHLDVDSILKLRATILRLKHSGVAFLITSHIFSDLEKICDRILFLKNGKLVTDSATDKLIQEYGDLESAYLNIFTPEQ
jgi:ABC-type multidrug transport system ATPase subunit